MQMLIRRDDRCRYLRSREQLEVIGGHEIGADFVSDELGAIGLDLRQSDEVDLGMPRCDLAAKQSNSARADNRNADALRILFHETLRCLSDRPDFLGVGE